MNNPKTSSISWAVPELTAGLLDALVILEESINSDLNDDRVKECNQYLSQVSGIFSITNCPSEFNLCTEIQDTVLSLRSKSPKATKTAVTAIAESILLLIDVLKGNTPHTALLESINNLCALSGKELYSEGEQFKINIATGINAFRKASGTMPNEQYLKRLRAHFQKTSLCVFRNSIRVDDAQPLRATFQRTFKLGTPYLAALSVAFIALSERLVNREISVTLAIKAQFQRFDRLLKRLSHGVEYEDIGLLKNVLFYISIGFLHNDLGKKLCRSFQIEFVAANNSLNQTNRLPTSELYLLIEILLGELNQVKAFINQAVENKQLSDKDSRQICSLLTRANDSLLIIGATNSRSLIRKILSSVDDLSSLTDINESQFEAIANYIEKLEQNLQQQLSLQSGVSFNVMSAQRALLEECRTNFSGIKAFLSATEPNTVNTFPLVKRDLQQISGVMQFSSLSVYSPIVQSLFKTIDQHMATMKQGLSSDQIKLISEIVAGLDFAMECQQNDIEFNESVLIKSSIQRCKDLQAMFDRLQPSTRQEQSTTKIDALEDNDDDDISAIFIKEALSIIPTAREQLHNWHADGKPAALINLRRAFHTLKGGGRMVSAVAIAELSLSIEQVLNLVIDNSLHPSAEIFTLVGSTLDELPRMLDALPEAPHDNTTIADIKKRAQLLVHMPENQVTNQVTSAGLTNERKELILSFVLEAEQLRRSIVTISRAIKHQSAGVFYEKLDFGFLILSDSTIGAEITELADSFMPFRQLLQYYNDECREVPNELIALISIWANQFDLLLADLKLSYTIDLTLIEEAVRSATILLAQETSLPNTPLLSAQKQRILPLHHLMADGLDGLIVAHEMIERWLSGSLDSPQLTTLTNDLKLLSEVATKCGRSEISELCELIQSEQNALPVSKSINRVQADWLNNGYEYLLLMLDAVATWHIIPHLPVLLIRNRPSNDDTVALPPEALVHIEKPQEPTATAKSPSASTMSDEDFQDELLDTLIEEAREHIKSIEQSIRAWRELPSAYNYAETIHRALHTLKGGARLANLNPLGDYVHAFESFIIDQQLIQKADPLFFNKANEWFERLVEYVDNFSDMRSRSEDTASLSAPMPPADADNSAQQSEALMVQTIAIDMPPSTLPNPTNNTQPQKSGASETFEYLKLKTSLLENMINLSAEGSVYRGRVETQLSQFDATLEELDSTSERIKQLARRLEAETDAQINYRHEKIAQSNEAAGNKEGFDPLEMDRYSTLQQFSRQLLESVSDLTDLRTSLLNGSRDANLLLHHSSRIQSELNSRLLQTRMVPFEHIVPRLELSVRKTARELAKKVDIEFSDLSDVLDRQIIEQLVPAIEHVLRNAIDHSIETPDNRVKAKKPARAIIRLHLDREGSYLALTISDDGAGINYEKVRSKIIKQEMLSASKAKNLSNEQLSEVLFQAGFSTAKEVTQISGRGTGMDVIRNTLTGLGGRVSIDSVAGVGSTIKLLLPFTLSVNRSLLVIVAGENYTVPLSSIEALVRIPKAELGAFYQDRSKPLAYDGADFSVGYLGEILKTAPMPELDSFVEPTVALLLFKTASHSIALFVDELLGSQDAMIKALDAPFSQLPGISGASILANGKLVVALDLPPLVATFFDHAGQLMVPEIDSTPSVINDKPMIMVVDDSVTVRKVTSRFLTREGFTVTTARDGAEALQMIQGQTPDLMLLDVEMPRMDGFELLSILRSSNRFRNIPVLLITSRTGAKHRDRALAGGAENYFGKPYQENELLLEINKLLGTNSAEDK